MQLSPLGLLMFVQLLFDVFCVEASRGEVGEDTSASKEAEKENFFEAGSFGLANDSSRARRGRTTFVKAILANPSLSSTQILAQKFASDALKSPKVQETIKRLSDMKLQELTAHSVRNDVAKLPAESRNYHKSMGRQRARKRKRKRHKEQRKRTRGHRSRSSSQRKYDAMSEPKMLKRRRFTEQAEFNVKQDGSHSVEEAESESMVQRLMKTTTKDPTKKSPGDQGIEYSEYYNDDDVLGELPAGKARLKLERTIKSPSVRFARQIANATSFYDYQLGSNYVQTHRPYLNEASESVKNIQNYPDALQDNSPRYLPNYGLAEQRDNPVDYSSVGITDGSLSDPTQLLSDNESSVPGPQTINSSEMAGQEGDVHRPIVKSRVSDPADTMQQPFGKVLESLGISVNRSLRNNVRPNEDSPSTIPRSSPKSIRNGFNDLRAGLQHLKESNEAVRKHDEAGNEDPRTTVEERKVSKNMDKRKKSTLDPAHVHVQMNETKSGAKRKRAKICRSSILEEERSNVSSTVKETKEVANQILNRIMDELEELKMDHTKSDMKEGVPCKLTGSWVTSQAGVRIDMRIRNHSMAVTLAAFAPEHARPGLINATWNVSGNVPFKRGGPFSLLATDNHSKTLAVFVGACRVCQGVDTIEGVWSIAREPRDCRDFAMATRIVNDVFRRTRMTSETKQKLQSLLQGCMTNSNTTSLSINEMTTIVPKKKRA